MKLRNLVIAGLLMVTVPACAFLTNKPPVLSPTTSTAVTNGLTALYNVLKARNVDPAALTVITDVQQAISQDVGGTTWGALVRTALNDLYSQLPLSVQNDTVVWASLAALEVALATVGA